MPSDPILQLRYELSDTDTSFPLLSDSEYTYFLNKHDLNINRAMLDAAKSILFKLSMRASEESVDIFTIRGAEAAKQYMQALKMFIRDPSLNPLNKNVQGYFGGISLSDMQANVDNPDNNIIVEPSNSNTIQGSSLPIGFFD